MKFLSPILAAVDFSSSSAQVLAHAATLGAALGRDWFALHVVSEGRLRDWEEDMGVEAETALRIVEVTRRLGELAAESCGKAPSGILVRVGRVYQGILDVVHETGADLLILGAHDVSKRRLGALAAHCARSMPADVMILRDWQGMRIRKIAACVDFSRSSAVALGRAIDIATAHGASVEVIHVVFPASRDPWGRVLEKRMDDPAGYEPMIEERARSRMEEFLAPFREKLAGIDFSTTFLEGESPAAAITAHVQATGIDLTAMGSHATSWMEEFVLGSNAERLTHDSVSSVLIAR